MTVPGWSVVSGLPDTVCYGASGILFTVTFIRASGTECDGYVDDLAMTLG